MYLNFGLLFYFGWGGEWLWGEMVMGGGGGEMTKGKNFMGGNGKNGMGGEMVMGGEMTRHLYFMLPAHFGDVDDNLSDHNVVKIFGFQFSDRDLVKSCFVRILIGFTRSLLLNFLVDS